MLFNQVKMSKQSTGLSLSNVGLQLFVLYICKLNLSVDLWMLINCLGLKKSPLALENWQLC